MRPRTTRRWRGGNYVAQAGTVTFGAGEILKTIEILLIDNQVYSGDTQFRVKLSNAAGATLGTYATADVVIKDDDKPPVLTLQAPSAVQEGDIGVMNIPIAMRLTGATNLPVTVSWSAFEGGALQGQSGQLQFAPGETQKTFTVTYTANTTPQLDRSLSVGITNATNATISGGSATIKIVDDDFALVSLGDATVAENAGKVVVPLQLSQASQKPITVTYETRNGTALAGTDYVATTGTLTVAPGSSITVQIINDNLSEPMETFSIVLTSIAGGKIDRSTAIVAIVDDDVNAPPAAPPHRRSARH